MQIEKQDIRVGPENILSTIAVMGIPINNQDSLASELGLGVGRGHSNIVKKAKAPRTGGLGVMPRRAYKRKRAVAFTFHDRFNSGNGGASGYFRRFNAAR